MRINHNIPALIANNQLAATNNNLAKSLQKLSSGKRINKAADDAAGLAISQKMDTQVRGLTQATRNANDGISVIQTAEGALNEVHSMLQRMRELAVQVSNGTYDEVDRASVQDEINQLNEEIQRISDTTEFNERKLLNGEIDRRAYSTTKNLNIVSLSDSVNPADYGLKVTQDARQAVLVGATLKPDTAGLLDADTKTLVTEKASGTININGEEVTIEAGDTADDVYDKIRELCERVNVDVFTVSDMTVSSATADVNAGYKAETFAFDASKRLVFCSKEYGSDQKVEIYCDSTELKTLLGITNGRATGIDVKAEFPEDTKDLDGDSNKTERVGFSDTATIACKGNVITVTDKDGFEMKFEPIIGAVGTRFVDAVVAAGAGDVTKAAAPTGGTAIEAVVNVLDAGPMDLQIGANEGQMMEIRIPAMTPKALGIDKLNLATADGAQAAITTIDAAVNKVSQMRSKLGAYQNRLEHTVANLGVASENMTESLSRIEDADMAAEMSAYTQTNVLAQAGTSMLAKANEMPNTVLQLLQQ